jgi:hypothetical protein
MRIPTFLIVTLLACGIALATAASFPSSALAEPGKGKEKHKTSQNMQAEKDDNVAEVIAARFFSALERKLIAEYFGEQWTIAERKGSLPPGLAKRDSLPPGLQKQLIRNGKLPPGLAKRDLPNDLLKRLGTPPKGTQRYIVGADIILVDLATNVLLDVIKGALYPPRNNNIIWNN